MVTTYDENVVEVPLVGILGVHEIPFWIGTRPIPTYAFSYQIRIIMHIWNQ